MKSSSVLIRIFIFLLIYFGLTYFAGAVGHKLLYPVRIMVTFLHELGHALGALLTGGAVDKIQINANGSGWARTAGGNRAIVIMGGYIGSALFGNMLFYIGAKSKSLSKPVLYILAGSMGLVALIWFNSLFTSALLLLFSLSLILVAWKTKFSREFVMFFGLTSILYIIQDFRVGPSSDLEAYAKELVIFSPQVWMYIWLFIVLLLFLFNIRLLMRSR